MILVPTRKFTKAFKRLVKKNPPLQNKILKVLDLLADNPFNPSLKSHKLTGELSGLWACSLAYDGRIIYTFKKDQDTGDDLIILIDIGTHDEVY